MTWFIKNQQVSPSGKSEARLKRSTKTPNLNRNAEAVFLR